MVAVATSGGIYCYINNQQIGQNIPIITQTPKDEAAGWQTYRNEEHGFEIKYPSGFIFSSEGANFVQQTMDKGEQVSGTVQPSYDTIIFSDGNNELGRIEIFHKYAEDIIEENYKDKGYLYLFGPCDVRWGFQPEVFSLNSINSVNLLTVKGKSQEDVSQNCNYLKNSDGNLIVLSDKDYKPDIFNQILSTFKFIETKDISEEEAIKIVKNLPEVKNWLSFFTGPGSTGPTTGGKPMIVVDSKEDEGYKIHVYEELSDHTATFGWYSVNKKTGETKSSF